MHIIDKKELEAVEKVLNKSKLFRYRGIDKLGHCDLFESKFAQKLNVKNALLLNSGTNSLYLSLKASNIGVGDEVIIPSYTFVATAQAVVMAGAIPVIADINDDLGIDLNSIKSKVSDRTKAIIVVHMDGLVCDLDPLLEFCNKQKLVLIEDVAQAMGGKYRGKYLGSYGDFGCFSLNENKVLSCGEGGILVTNKEDEFKEAKVLHDGPSLFGPTNRNYFQDTRQFLGESMRVSEISGAIMNIQLDRLDNILSSLKERKQAFINGFKDNDYCRLVLGGDTDGDCSTSIHLQFNDISYASHIFKSLRDDSIIFYPVTARPAHACWQWMHLLNNKDATIDVNRNPYALTDKKYVYHKAHFLNGIHILSSTWKIDVDIEKSVDFYSSMAEKVNNSLQGV